MAINDELANAVLRNTHRTVAFEKTINQQIRGNLVELERELARMLGDADLESALPRFQEQRLKRLRKDVNEAINTTYLGNTRDLQAGLTEIAAQTQRLTVQSFNKVFTYDIFDITLTRAELRTLARNPVVLGGTTTENWFKQNRGLKQGFTEQMRLGLAQGETNQQLVNRLIGNPTGARETVIIKGRKRSVPLRTGGLMDVPKHQATALVRTSAQTVSNETLDTIYRDNDDVIGGIATIVTLDGRTTLICMSLSGASWDVKTGDPLPESPKQIPYPGPPPYHWQALAGDSMVVTQQGLRRIDSIEPGDMVMTGKGRFRPCYAVHRKRHKGRILDIGFDSGSKLTITDDHPLPIAGRGWQPAGDLKVGDQCFQYAESIDPERHRAPPCGVADCSPTLLAEELVSDEVRCLPLFRDLPVDFQHDASREREIDDVSILAKLEQEVGHPQVLKDFQEVQLAACRDRCEVAGAFAHGNVHGGAVTHGVAVAHSLGDLGQSRVGVLGAAVSPDLGGVLGSALAECSCALPLSAGADALSSAMVGQKPVGQGQVALDGAERFAGVDVAALDELVKTIVVVPGSGFEHTTCISIAEREWEGMVYNLSIVGDETYIANGVLVHNCRTVVSPITKSWEELFGKKKAEILDKAKRPDSVRASMNGEVPGRQQYTGFLQSQSSKFQDSVMGKSRAQLFRDGKIELNQLTDAMLKPLSLAQLEKIAA